MMFGNAFGYAHHYAFNHDGRADIYCVPPKNACSMVKFMCILQHRPELESMMLRTPSAVHQYSHLALMKQHKQVWDALHPILFVRHPYNRLISAFISKFILFPEDAVLSSLLGILDIKGEDVTFRQFLGAVCDIPDEWLDPHFRQQSSFLVRPLQDYSVIDLDSKAFQAIMDTRFGQKAETFQKARQDEEDNIFGTKSCSGQIEGSLIDRPVKYLRYLRMNGLQLQSLNFLDVGLEEKIKQRCSSDIELLAYCASSS